MNRYMMKMMKRFVLVWRSSPRSLMHSILKFTIPSFLIAFFIIKYSTLDSFHSHSHSHSQLLHTLPIQKSYLTIDQAVEASNGALASPLASNRKASSGYGDHHQAKKKTHTSLGDWDQQRKAWLTENGHLADGRSQPNILLVTGSSPKQCENPLGDHLLLRFIKNKMDYGRLHGIDIFYNRAILNREMTDCWSKLAIIRTLMLSHPEMDWIWWMDSDAAFTDMTFELPMEKYEQYNLVLPGWGGEVYVKKSWTGLNAGVFLIRNCQWSLDFMESWAANWGKTQKQRDELGVFFSEFLTNRPVFEGDDQAALIYILITQKKKWEKRVFLENSYSLHGYWETIVDRYEEMMKSSHAGYGDDRWPFVTHFVGCKPCGMEAIKERCLKQMERAFNFADNQVLHYYGFEHKHLGTSEVVRAANETMQSSSTGK